METDARMTRARKTPHLTLKNDLPVLASLALLAGAVFVLSLGQTSLLGNDEPRYAEIAREMLRDGHWFVPHFNGAVYYDKPPLFFWMIASLSALPGEVTEFTARLPAALSGLGTVVLCFLLGTRLVNRRAGAIAALILLTSPQFFWFSRQVRLDMTFTFFITLAITGFISGYHSEARSRTRFFLLCYASIGLAILTKGPLGIVFPLGTILLFLALQRELRVTRQMHSFLGLVTILAILGVWLVPAVLIGRWEYLRGNVIDTGFLYLLNPGDHARQAYRYIVDILSDMFPWSLALPGALVYSIRAWKKNRDQEPLLFLAWFAIIMGVLFLGRSARKSYLLPIEPAAALLIAILWDKSISGDGRAVVSRWMVLPLQALPFALLPAAAIAPFIERPELQGFARYVIAGSVMTVVVAISLIYCLRIRRLVAFTAILVGYLVVVEIFYVQTISPRRSEIYSEQGFCQEVAGLVGPEDLLVTYKHFRNAYPFYTKRFPQLLVTETALNDALHSGQRVFCIIPESEFQNLSPSIRESLHRHLEFTRKRERVLLVSNT